MPLTTFLFDLDGTLIDSIDLILKSLEHTLTVHRGESPPREFFSMEWEYLWALSFGTSPRMNKRWRR